MKDPIHRYLIRLYWSDDDEGYVAEVPALPGCVAVGASPEKAVRDLAVAMKLWLASAKKHGDPIPEPDVAREEIQRLAPFLNVSKLARSAGLNNHTLASKLRRNSPFTAGETKAILKALATA